MAFVLKALPLLSVFLSSAHASPHAAGSAVSHKGSDAAKPNAVPVVTLKQGKAQNYIVAFKKGKKYVSSLRMETQCVQQGWFQY